MTNTTDTIRLPKRNRRARRLTATAGIAAAITAVAIVGSNDTSSGSQQEVSRVVDPSGLGAALAVTYDVLPPGIDDASQLGYPEAACATDLRTWILGG